MNIFKPYIVVQQTNSSIQLQLSVARQRVSFFLFRIFPFLLIGLFAFVFFKDGFKEDENIPVFFTAIVFVIPLVLLFGNYVTDLTVDKYGFAIKKAKLNGNVELFYNISDIEKITCKIRGGKGGGMFYKLKLKEGKSVEFLRIPVLFLSRENAKNMNEVFKTITNLSVENI